MRLTLLAEWRVVTGCRNHILHGEAATKTIYVSQEHAAVLTTDRGAEMDDEWALAHLLLSPELDLRAVITTHAASICSSSAGSLEKATEVVQKSAPARSASVPVVAGYPT